MLFAQNGVTVSNLSVNAGTVTFNVRWNRETMPVALWSDTVWVFVDYNDAGVMKRLPVTDATASAGTVTKVPNNDKGVWVVGNARTNSSFSATVQLLTAVKNVGGACVYASNYPPVGKYIATNVIAFTGTAPYTVILKGNPEPQTAGSYYIVPGAIASFTDKTGAPGIISAFYQPQGTGCTYTEPAVVGTFANFDPSYSAATYVSLTDERDNKNYPVLKMGNRWMMARNLNYQENLTWQTNSNKPTTVVGQDVGLIGSFWCPGTSGTSTVEACEVYGALYSWETAMMLDGTGTWTEVTGRYLGSTSPANAGTYNHGRTAHSGTGSGGRGICPENWHVPTDAEWGLFFDAVEGSGSTHSSVSGNNWVGVNAGKWSKAACLGDATDSAPLWTKNNGTDGEDTYGFRGLPSGYRDDTGFSFNYRGARVYFWSSSANSSSYAWFREFFYNHAGVVHWADYRSRGYSVRCIRD
jgi:uncharacterized protein (TIGR02145 family)